MENVMQEKLITFETSKLSKEKGFDFSGIEIRDSNTLKVVDNVKSRLDYFGTMKESNLIQLPTQSLLQKWLREVHKINVESNYLPNIQKYRCLFVPMTKEIPNKIKYSLKSKYYGNIDYNTYEEALEAGLLEGLKLIKL